MSQDKILSRLIDAASKGRILDVSKMEAGGKGAVSIAVPKTSRSKKVMANSPAAPPIVSDNAASYRAAMVMMGPSYSQFANLYAAGSTIQPIGYNLVDGYSRLNLGQHYRQPVAKPKSPKPKPAKKPADPPGTFRVLGVLVTPTAPVSGAKIYIHYANGTAQEILHFN